MKVLSTNSRQEVAESELFGGSTPELFEKRHLKEIVMNVEAKETETEDKISSSTDELKVAVESECGKSEENSEAEVTSNSIGAKNSPKQSNHATNGALDIVANGDSEATSEQCHEVVSIGNSSENPSELNLQDKHPDTKKVQDVEEDKVKDAEGDRVKDGQSEKVEDAQGEIAAESSSKLMDDTSSTEDEDIRLVVEDASDETDTEPQVAKTPEINTETEKLIDKSDEGIEVENEEPIKESNDADKDLAKASENPLAEDLLSDDEPKIISEKPLEKVLSDDIQGPSSPMDSGIALDNITSNFDEDSCTSFDKSLEEIDPKKTEDKNETPKDDTPVEKILDEAVIIEPELVAKANSNDEETAMEINEVEENKNETSTEPTRKRSNSNLDQVDIDSKKFKTDESDIKNEDGVSNSEAEKLKGVVRNMTRKELEKFLVDAFIANMTRKSQMAVQEQELNKAKVKCEAYKKTLSTLQKQFVDLKKAVAAISESNKNAAKFARPKTIVRNVSVQVPSRCLSSQQPQKPPEKKIRTLPPVQRITNTQGTSPIPPNLHRAPFAANQLGRPPINRQVLVQKQGVNMYATSNSPALMASLKSPPKTSTAVRTSSAPTLTTTDSPVQIVQSGGRYIIPSNPGGQGSKAPVAYIISNSKTQPMLMQNGVPGLLSVKPANNGSIQSSGRSPNVIQRSQIHQSTNANLQGQQRQVMATAIRNRVIPQVKAVHPAPLPPLANQINRPGWKALPPKPSLKIQTASKGIMLSWHLPQFGSVHEEIKSYQIYAYQETSEEPDSRLWKTVGDVKALALPMACTLTQFKEGYKYHFSVRAVDIHNRMGASSETMSIILQKKYNDTSNSNQSH